MLPSEKNLQRRVECLRFASELIELARHAPFSRQTESRLRMAKVWTNHATELSAVAGVDGSTPCRSILHQHSSASDRVVLVVEDEPLLRILTVEIVEDAGFVALQACNADEAIIQLERRGDIDLVLTDVQMPGSMDGLELAQMVRMRWPLINIVVVSGQSKPKLGELPFGSRFIAKPYHAAVMVSALDGLLRPLELQASK